MIEKQEQNREAWWSDDVTAEALKLIAAVFREDNDWASQPRAVWTGEAMEKELDELFPVEVGVQAIKERRRQRKHEESSKT